MSKELNNRSFFAESHEAYDNDAKGLCDGDAKDTYDSEPTGSCDNGSHGFCDSESSASCDNDPHGFYDSEPTGSCDNDTSKLYDVVLVSTFAERKAYCKRLATGAPQRLFGCTVTTFSAWITDLWELYGDGRTIISPIQRSLFMQAVFTPKTDTCENQEPERGYTCEHQDPERGYLREGHQKNGASLRKDGYWTNNSLTPRKDESIAGEAAGACVAAGEQDAAWERDAAGEQDAGGYDTTGEHATFSFPGMVALGIECIQNAAGTPAFERALTVAQQTCGLTYSLQKEQNECYQAFEQGSYEAHDVLEECHEDTLQQGRTLQQEYTPQHEHTSQHDRTPQQQCLDHTSQNSLHSQEITAREYALLARLGQYKKRIEAAGLIEQGDAASALIAQAALVFPHPLRVLVATTTPLDWQQRFFLESIPQLQVRYQSETKAPVIKRAPDDIKICAARPSGVYAEPALIADLIRDLKDKGPLLVACKDPLTLYSAISPALVTCGITCAVQAHKRFAETEFGRTWMALFQCLHADPWDPSTLIDVLLSSFSGIAKKDAYTIAQEIRADRLTERSSVLARLRRDYELFSQLEELASDPDASVLLGTFELQVQTIRHRSAAYRAEQQAAINALRSVMDAARKAHASIEACAQVLDQLTFRVDRTTSEEPQSKPEVLITTQKLAAQREPGSCATLILANMTAADYPLADKDTATSVLLEKLGYQPFDTALNRARRVFNALMQLPSESLIVEWCVNDVNAEPTYPCAVLEEFIDCYRVKGADEDEKGSVCWDHDNPFDHPITRGEEMLYANALSAPADTFPVWQAYEAEAHELELSDTVHKKLLVEGLRGPAVLKNVGPSPSALELYLECPYKWFVSRQLNLESLDEEFGARERGIFAHEALETFYRHFQEQGSLKVTNDNLLAAQKLMNEVCDRLAEEQPYRKPKERLVPTSKLEERELSALKQQLVRYLEFEKDFLPTFHPAYFEYKIGEEKPLFYAGGFVVGKVDRIDIDDAGHAVIVDYKGSLGQEEYEIAGKTPENPGKIQTRIYAQVIQRTLGLDVVGALYVSYGKLHAVAGAYDPRILNACHLPAARHERSACGVENEWPQVLAGTAVASDNIFLSGKLSASDEKGNPALSDNGNSALSEKENPALSGKQGTQNECVQAQECHYSTLTFSAMLDATEQRAAQARAAMQAGCIAPAPTRKGVCTYCPAKHCPKREI